MTRLIGKFSVFLLSIFYSLSSFSQCAMCRTQVVNNVSHGETALAEGLNMGILYLFFTPYVAIGVVAFLWFRNSKYNEGKESLASRLKRQMS